MSLVLVDDRDSRVRYIGSWLDSGGPPEYQLTRSGSSENGARLEFGFQGSKIFVYGTIVDSEESPNPRLSCQIDDQRPVEVALTPTDQKQFNQLICESGSLSNIWHTLTLRIAGTGNGVWVDYFAIQPEAEPTTRPTTSANPTTAPPPPVTSSSTTPPPPPEEGTTSSGRSTTVLPPTTSELTPETTEPAESTSEPIVSSSSRTTANSASGQTSSTGSTWIPSSSPSSTGAKNLPPGAVDAEGAGSDSESKDQTNIGAIVGGVVGGVAALLLLALAVFFFLKKRRSRNQSSLDSPSFPPPAAASPVSYQAVPFTHGPDMGNLGTTAPASYHAAGFSQSDTGSMSTTALTSAYPAPLSHPDMSNMSSTGQGSMQSAPLSQTDTSNMSSTGQSYSDASSSNRYSTNPPQYETLHPPGTAPFAGWGDPRYIAKPPMPNFQTNSQFAAQS